MCKRTFKPIGELLPIVLSEIPFIPKRVFTISGVKKDEVRGKHAHIKERQLLVCIRGIIRVSLFDGIHTDMHTLSPGEYIEIPSMIWSQQRYVTEDNVLLVFGSEEYDEKDYIRDMHEFLKRKWQW